MDVPLPSCRRGGVKSLVNLSKAPTPVIERFHNEGYKSVSANDVRSRQGNIRGLFLGVARSTGVELFVQGPGDGEHVGIIFYTKDPFVYRLHRSTIFDNDFQNLVVLLPPGSPSIVPELLPLWPDGTPTGTAPFSGKAPSTATRVFRPGRRFRNTSIAAL